MRRRSASRSSTRCPIPGINYADRLYETNKLNAQIVKVTPNYLLVEVIPGILAMVPKGEFDASAQFGAGQEVEVTLLTINHATRRITASIQHVADVPLEEIEQYAAAEEIGIETPAPAPTEPLPAE